MRIFYRWLKEIESIVEDVLVSVKIADVCYKAIEIRVDFLSIDKNKYFCVEIIDADKENFETNLFISLNRIKLFIKRHILCLFNQK